MPDTTLRGTSALERMCRVLLRENGRLRESLGLNPNYSLVPRELAHEAVAPRKAATQEGDDHG